MQIKKVIDIFGKLTVIRVKGYVHRHKPIVCLALGVLAWASALLSMFTEDGLRLVNSPGGVMSVPYKITRVLLFHEEKDSVNFFFGLAALLAFCLLLLAGSELFKGSSVLLFVDKTRLNLWRFRKRSFIVVCGLGRIGLQIVRGNERKSIVVLERDPNNPNIRQALSSGAIVLTGDAADGALLEEAHVRQAERVFAVTNDDAVNVAIAAEVIRHADPAGPAKHPVCHAHVTEPGLSDLLRESGRKLQHGLTGALTTFDIHHITAARLLRWRLVRHLPPNDKAAHYFCIGFGAMGRALAREIALNAHFLNRRRACMSVLDYGIEEKRDAFLDRYPAFCPKPGTLDLGKPAQLLARMAKWDFFDPAIRPVEEAHGEGDGSGPGIEYVCLAEFLPLSGEVLTGGVWDLLRARLRHADTCPVFIVCFDGANEQYNLQAAYKLHKRFPGHPVYVFLSQNVAARELLEETSPLSIIPFSYPEGESMCEEIIQPYREKLARISHDQYLKANPSCPQWEELLESLQESNRKQADHIEVKLALLGLCTSKQRNAQDRTPVKYTKQIEEALEALAEVEHVRWNAERLMDGWRYASASDKPAKYHNCLVDYARLDDSIKKFDRVHIRNIAEALDNTERRIVPFPPARTALQQPCEG